MGHRNKFLSCNILPSNSVGKAQQRGRPHRAQPDGQRGRHHQLHPRPGGQGHPVPQHGRANFTGSAIHVLDVADMPDYVFADTFRLRPLREVESYIRQHSHLPEVPSATDFRAKGMNMLDMDRLLLKKVEELTLYAIEQEKRLERLETTVELQNKRIEILSKSISGR